MQNADLGGIQIPGAIPYPHKEVPSAYNQFVYLGYTVPHSIPSRPNQRPISVESFRAQHPSRANQPRALRSDSIQALDTA